MIHLLYLFKKLRLELILDKSTRTLAQDHKATPMSTRIQYILELRLRTLLRVHNIQDYFTEISTLLRERSVRYCVHSAK